MFKETDMSSTQKSRRNFLKRSAVAAGAALAAGWRPAGRRATAQAAPSVAGQHPIRLGGPLFSPAKDPEQMALAYRKLGYRAAYCPAVPLEDRKRIDDFARAFAKHDVIFAEVGRWVNLLEADPKKRAENIKKVTDGLALAEAIGARCCVDIAGSFNPTSWHGPDPRNLSKEFFDATVQNARTIIDAVKPKRAKLTFEMMGWSLPDTPDSYLALLKAIDRPAFGVHLDPCNIINCPAKYYNTTAVLNECFDKLGPWIVSCHAKDLTWDIEMNIHFREVCPGAGVLDYATYLKRLATLPNDVPLMLEHLKGADEYDQARRHIMEVGQKSSVSFE
jgi:sugar phosphate isomerase/epimerase